VWYGGLIGGVLAYYLQIRAKKLPMALMYDAAAPALALAYAVGRMGCFLVGDDYGVPTDSWVGIAFPEGSPPSTAGALRAVGVDVPANIPDATVLRVHPTQLYEIGLSLLILGVLWKLGAKRLRQGQLFAVWMCLYAVERFLIEFVRAKGDRFVLGLSTSQIMSVLLLIAGVALWLHQRSAAHTPAADPQGTAPRRSTRPARAG
jgi:phosphatidylglycerol:prolipoprotein diacylglycerol transferase